MSKPYDRLFKTLAEEDPRGLLHFFGSLTLDEPAEIETVSREILLPALEADHVYRVRSGLRQWIAHFEAQAHYRSDLPERLAWYAVALAMRFKLPVETTMVLLVARHAPGFIPDRFETVLGSVELSVRYRVIRLWELDPQRIFDAKRPTLLPWIPLMGSPDDLLEKVAAEIVRTRDERLAVEFVVLGGLRYDKRDLAAMLGRGGTMFRLTQEMIEESSFYQMVIEQGMEKGIEQGMEKGIQQGRLEGARRIIRYATTVQFPELGPLPELDAVTDLERLETLLRELLTAPDPEAARAAIGRLQD